MQQQEVAGEGHEAARIARRALQIDDPAVGGVGGIDRVVQPALKPLVGAGRAERLAARERLARQDLDPLDPRESGRRRQQRAGERERAQAEAGTRAPPNRHHRPG